MIIFVWGFKGYLNMRVAPEGALNIYVTAHQWAWQFQYPDGTRSIRELAVPVNEPVKLTMSSEDVIHSFFVPAFRVKMDVLPNRYTTLWFEATKVGEFPLYCAEYCGTSHSDMSGTVKVLTRPDYEDWLLTGGLDPGEMTPAEYGAFLYQRFQCYTCHSVDGRVGQGPTLMGIWGHEVRLADGSTVVVDENYIRESIMNPTAKIVRGYQPIMFSFQGTIKAEDQMSALIEYIKSLTPAQ
jgi:cytochrome c oxidase subunit 2